MKFRIKRSCVLQCSTSRYVLCDGGRVWRLLSFYLICVLYFCVARFDKWRAKDVCTSVIRSSLWDYYSFHGARSPWTKLCLFPLNSGLVVHNELKRRNEPFIFIIYPFSDSFRPFSLSTLASYEIQNFFFTAMDLLLRLSYSLAVFLRRDHVLVALSSSFFFISSYAFRVQSFLPPGGGGTNSAVHSTPHHITRNTEYHIRRCTAIFLLRFSFAAQKILISMRRVLRPGKKRRLSYVMGEE